VTVACASSARRPKYFRYTTPGVIRAKLAAEEAITPLGHALARTRRFLFGRPLSNEEELTERLPKWKALPIFSSDVMSSVAYASEASLFTLLAAGTSTFYLLIPISLAIVAVLFIVTFSYRLRDRADRSGPGERLERREPAHDEVAELARRVDGRAHRRHRRAVTLMDSSISGAVRVQDPGAQRASDLDVVAVPQLSNGGVIDLLVLRPVGRWVGARDSDEEEHDLRRGISRDHRKAGPCPSAACLQLPSARQQVLDREPVEEELGIVPAFRGGRLVLGHDPDHRTMRWAWPMNGRSSS